MDSFNRDFKSNSQKVITLLKEDLKSIRTGRANPAMLEGIVAEVYDGSTKLKLMELASITTDGPSTLVVVPFDPSTIADIERAILKSPLGISPQVQGTKIMVKVPPLSQEQREKMVKVVHGIIEKQKERIRLYRDELRKKIRQLLDKKEITEDQKFRFEKETDNLTYQTMEEIKIIMEYKDNEIMKV